MEAKLEKLRQILRDSLAFQYSSAASMYILDGQRPPQKFGSNCYEQARAIRNILLAAGFDQTYLIEDTLIGRHRPVICIAEGKTFYFDPYLMHYDLIDLSANSFETVFDSFPIVSGQKSIITIIKQGNALAVTKKWPLRKRVDVFTFNLSKTSIGELAFDDYFLRAFHPEQDTLSIRFLNTTTGATDHLIHSLSDGGENAADLWIKTNEGAKIMRSDSTVFDTKLDKLSKLIDSNKAEVIGFLHGAIELHKKFLDKKPNFPQGPVPSPYE